MGAVAHIEEFKTGRFFSKEFRGEMSWNGWEWNNLLRNEGCDAEGNPRFTDVAKAVGASDQGDARSLAVADLDNDGDLDIVVNHCRGDTGIEERARPAVLINRVGERRSWLAVELEGTDSNRGSVGAMVRIEAGGMQQLRRVSAGSSYASQHGLRLYFGLGDQPVVERLTVRWPSGREEAYEGLEARRLVRLVEGGGMELLELPGAAAAAAVEARTARTTSPAPATANAAAGAS